MTCTVFAAAGGQQHSVWAEGDAVYALRMLERPGNWFARFRIPNSCRLVLTCCSNETAIRVEYCPCDGGSVPHFRSDWLATFAIPNASCPVFTRREYPIVVGPEYGP